VGAPPSLAIPEKILVHVDVAFLKAYLQRRYGGRSDISRASRTTGRRPVTIPKSFAGRLLRKDNHVSPGIVISLLIFEKEATTATGIDQKRMVAHTIPMVTALLTIRSQPLILRFFQMTSDGIIPV
jgi:hypothetical protein